MHIVALEAVRKSYSPGKTIVEVVEGVAVEAQDRRETAGGR